MVIPIFRWNSHFKSEFLDNLYFLLKGLHFYLLFQIWSAQKMIQQIGVTLPEESPEKHLLDLAFKKVTNVFAKRMQKL